jgi:hypothetical protein
MKLNIVLLPQHWKIVFSVSIIESKKHKWKSYNFNFLFIEFYLPLSIRKICRDSTHQYPFQKQVVVSPRSAQTL